MFSSFTARLTHRLFGTPLLRNSIRGEYVEEMVTEALEPEWALCAGDWGACDLIQVGGALRIQVKQSAARQSWHADNSPPPRPRFSIAYKSGHYEGGTVWIAEPGRNAEIFVFGWHDRTDPAADHRDAAQWIFFVVAEADLPAQASLSLAALQRLAAPVSHDHLRSTVGGMVKRLMPPSPSPRT